MPLSAASAEPHATIRDVGSGFDIPYLMPHGVISRLLPACDSFGLLLGDMQELWRTSLSASWLGDRFLEAVRDGELTGIG
jgi:hypothetical protein